RSIPNETRGGGGVALAVGVALPGLGRGVGVRDPALVGVGDGVAVGVRVGAVFSGPPTADAWTSAMMSACATARSRVSATTLQALASWAGASQMVSGVTTSVRVASEAMKRSINPPIGA